MRSEARLKLFTLDPDTQVTKIIPDYKVLWIFLFTAVLFKFSLAPQSVFLIDFFYLFKPFDIISCFHRNWTSLALSQTCGSLKRSSGRESWSAVTTCLSTCRAVLQRMKRDQQLMYAPMKDKQSNVVEGVNYKLLFLFSSELTYSRRHTSVNACMYFQVRKYASRIILGNVL